jgi:hypothetical protein
VGVVHSMIYRKLFSNVKIIYYKLIKKRVKKE